jgi:hypothetical protein
MDDSEDDTLSTLSEEELRDPKLLIVSNVLFEIDDIIDNVEKEYNFRTMLERAMLKYLNTNKLLRTPNTLVQIARLKCTRDKIQGTVNNLLPPLSDKVRNDPDSMSGLLLKSYGVSGMLASTLLEGIDLNLFENYLWDKPIPHDLSIFEKQKYILDNKLKIMGVPDRDISRTTPECLHIQDSILEIEQQIFNNKIRDLNNILSSNENKNNFAYCNKIASAVNGLGSSMFKEGTDYYNKIGYNPNDTNVSRDNPDPNSNKKSFAWAGRINHPNDFRRSLGMYHIKNINTGKPIPSNCFNSLRYYNAEFPLSKKVNDRGKYIPSSNLGGGHSVLYEYYSKYQKN